MALPSHLRSFWDDLKDGKSYAARREFGCAILAFGEAIRALHREVYCPMTGTEPPYEAYCDARYERGLAYWMNNQHAEAIEDFSDLLRLALKVKCPEALVIGSYLNRGILYFAVEEPGLACTDLRRVLERDPGNAIARRWLNRVESELFEWSKSPHVTLPDTLMPTIH